MTPEEQLRLYEQDKAAEQNIRDAITKAYQDLQPESTLVHSYENEQFPSFYSALSGYGADTGLTDLAPTTLLQNAWGNQARYATAAQAARDAFDVRRAGMEDLIKTGVSQWATGYQGAQNAYNRWLEERRMEEQKRQFEAQLALERERMRRASATASKPAINPALDAFLAETAWNIKEQERQAAQAQQEAWNAGANKAWSSSKSSGGNGLYTPVPLKNTLSGYSSKPSQTKVSTGSSMLDNIIKRIR